MANIIQIDKDWQKVAGITDLSTDSEYVSESEEPVMYEVPQFIVQSSESSTEKNTSSESVQCFTCSSLTTECQKNQYSVLEAHKVIRESRLPNFLGCKIPVWSKLNLKFLKEQLHDYHDTNLVDFLAYGFPISHSGQRTHDLHPKNHKGAQEFPKDIDAYLERELASNSILGPFHSNPLPSKVILSPLNTVPKKDCSERRVIVDMSFPEGAGAVNDGIEKGVYLGQQMNLSYPSVDNLVEIVKQKGQGCLLFKRDLRRFYRQIPVDPGDVHLLGYSWNNHIYLDRVLPMGMRSACFIAQRVTNAITFLAAKAGISLLNYIDDLAGAEKKEKAHAAHEYVGTLLSDAGLEETISKQCSPAVRMIFLGILFDTLKLTLEVTPERIVEILELLADWLNRVDASRRELESLLGILHFVASCVRQGRVFVSRLLNYLRGLPRKGRHILPADCLKDILWWQKYLEVYSGVSIMYLENWSKPDSQLACDACLHGCGGWSGNEAFHSPFPEKIIHLQLHINALELLCIVVALKVWGHRLTGKRMLIHCDNMTSVTVLNSGRTRDSFLQACLREIAFICALCQCEVRAVHIPGEQNRIPDLLSRWNLHEKYSNEFCEVNKSMQLTLVSVHEDMFDFSHDW